MELAVATLLLWLADCLRYAARMREPDVSSLRIFDIAGGHEIPAAVFLVVLGLTIMAGVLLTVGERNRPGALVRGIGLIVSSGVFGFVAAALHAQDPHTIAGGAYVFAAWRSFAVGWAHLRSRH